MELTLNRKHLNPSETIGELLVDDVFFCYTLEDKDRLLSSEMPLEQIKQIKIFAQTAIPRGRYEVVMSYSARFKRLLPLLVGVKGFEGIRIHAGNKKEDTEGCILVGDSKTDTMVLKSRVAMTRLMTTLTKAFKKEKVFITINR